jgi:S1-C subfamily serine protease
MGIIVDDQGHALLPMYTARSNISDNEMLPVLLCDGSVAPAKFIGSDKVTNISVIQILRQGLRPMALGTVPPAEGSLVMVMSVDPVATALRVWTRWSGAMALVIQTDGTISGFSNRGQFVAAGSRVSVARQLIQFGHVERPILGVVISTVPPNDPIRAMLKSLGQEPAIHVDKVIDGSPAARSGLQDGDLVLTLAGAPVTTALDFATAVSERRGPTELGILRQDQEIQITVDVQSPPQN